MIGLKVEAVTGHYGVPGQVSIGGTKTSYPTCPPSTWRGFLESLCGASFGSFKGRFAVGRAAPPSGVGMLYRRAQVWGSSPNKNEINRPFHVQVYTDPSYVVMIDGPWEQKVRDALDGKVDRFGTLYLGESEDQVHWIQEIEKPSDVQWLVPGQSMLLPVSSSRGYDNLRLDLAGFTFQAGDPHWFEKA